MQSLTLCVSCWIAEVLVGGSSLKPQVFSFWPVCNRVRVVSMLGWVQPEKPSLRKQRVAVVLGRGLASLSSLATEAGSAPHVILIRGLCKSYLNTTLITLFRNIRMCGRVPGTGFPHVLGVCGRHHVCTSVTGTGRGEPVGQVLPWVLEFWQAPSRTGCSGHSFLLVGECIESLLPCADVNECTNE